MPPGFLTSLGVPMSPYGHQEALSCSILRRFGLQLNTPSELRNSKGQPFQNESPGAKSLPHNSFKPGEGYMVVVAISESQQL